MEGSWNGRPGIIPKTTSPLAFPGARRASVSAGSARHASRKGASPAPTGRSRATGTIRGAGELFWAVERGRLLRLTDETMFEALVEVSAQGQTIRVALALQANAP